MSELDGYVTVSYTSHEDFWGVYFGHSGSVQLLWRLDCCIRCRIQMNYQLLSLFVL